MAERTVLRMSPWHPSVVMDVQVLVTHAASVAPKERHLGNPPRLIRAPDVCSLFQARDREMQLGFVDRWQSNGIMTQVVLIPKPGGRESRQWGHHAAHVTEPSRTASRTSPAMAWCAMIVSVCHGLQESQPSCW
jgi:hypothetical protein